MNLYEFAPIAALINIAHTVLTFLSDLLTPLAGGASAALAVVLLTVIVRTLLIPVGRSQVKAQIDRQRLAPQLAELQKKYKRKPELLQRKTMELYQKEKVSPLAGCLPMLAQTPVLMAVYGLFILHTIGGKANDLLTHTVFGVQLGDSLVHQISTGTVALASALLYAAIVLIIAVVAQASRSLLMPATPPAAARPEPAPGMPQLPDMTKITKVLSFMPFMTAIVATFVPLAAAIYLLVTVSWTLGERIILRKVLGADKPAEGTDAAGAAPQPA
ncbi:YidC/Oxa1 family membrane protein insertase [Paramicrobacterium humi]|uniref:Membrane protein insertase YidC n=1 Tax=Paramicrobacterium humi TaxID=640635 RepID=A0A1H4JUB4_9MICO|nr:YidC/Oxa1 family membrane protein insertase [Microbacterium humi]SEB49727.1 YidC/Oxa1 family membrane protein insertase [Microbacterium humi]